MTNAVRIIGAPTDYGANRRGVDMGPSAIRYAGLDRQIRAAGAACADIGDVRAPLMEERENGSDVNARHIDAVREVNVRLADDVAAAIEDGEVPLVLGGDHSVAIGSMAGSARTDPTGVVWFDAHGDFNTPSTSPSGNVHGMPLAAALGLDEFAEMDWATAAGLSEENVALVGLRDLDESERAAIRASDVTAYTMSDIDERGLTTVVEDALAVAADGVEGIHVSLDLDWLDPNEAPGVGTPVRGGVTYREAHAAMELLADLDRRYDVLRSLELVEVNPILDERNQTAEMAAELAASALGKRIL
ncbi:Arginase family enzyme [Halanaeroarchaeum sp. HSR-CO]|uniref:arginase n=1 Tax=Halanaeroarchaeum sp. HSR-CO TaxID=2866382 RepID=UPI00217EE1E1|nr:arginase [Halanaeroarchaeum sp. HSR-CO]UWG48197.1 Arginase family enzyme [Halanaeroarchaeum sp. HSR-CO]